jgi:hypothetical protein
MSKGRWVDNDARWFEQRMTYCALCGRVIPKRIWQTAIGEHVESFCEPACEDLYWSYLVGPEKASTH